MRLITSLIVASLAGTMLFGGLQSYLGQREPDPARAVMELYRNDREATMRLVEPATFICVPELDKLKTREARNLLPRLVAFTLAGAQDDTRMTDQEKQDLITKEIAPVLRHAPSDEIAVLGKAMKQTREEKNKLVGCITRTIVSLSAKRRTPESEPLVPDAEPPGT